MKIHIAYEITENPYGGANQFLRTLRNNFINKDLHTKDPSCADIVLFNSHHNVENIVNLKNSFPKKKFIHRVDGPIKLYNHLNDTRDNIVSFLNSHIADATIFQSEWSRQQNLNLGIIQSHVLSTVIGNAADTNIFKRQDKDPGDKVRILSTSFSPNMRKGYGYYKFLDENLDFNNFEYNFAGQSPVKFENIKNLGCLTSDEIASKINESDLFITASENDPCSNSLIEALTGGIPALALDSGGHPEILKEGGMLFKTKKDLLEKVKEMSNNLEYFRNKIETNNMEEIANRYLNFLKKVL